MKLNLVCPYLVCPTYLHAVCFYLVYFYSVRLYLVWNIVCRIDLIDLDRALTSNKKLYVAIVNSPRAVVVL
jgi:hypothetical protein